MNQEITLQVSDKMLGQVMLYATQRKRRLEELLSDWLADTIQDKLADEMSDSEILTLTKMKILPEKQERLSDLLFKNRESGLNKKEREELDLMVETCELNNLKKAEALQIAVKRGLIKSLT